MGMTQSSSGKRRRVSLTDDNTSKRDAARYGFIPLFVLLTRSSFERYTLPLFLLSSLLFKSANGSESIMVVHEFEQRSCC